MSKDVDFVTTDTTIRKASFIIFGRGINGLPVCEDKKLVGFITERDILAQFYPSVQEYIEDPFGTADFEKMEGKAPDILEHNVEEIMSRNPITVSSNTPLLRAQSLMFIHKVGRLPVIDQDGNLIGIISKRDIFRAIVKPHLSLHKEEGFFDWLAKYYDSIVDWRRRLGAEVPGLVALFRKEKVKKVLDVASATGEHAIALAKRGYEVYGIEKSTAMVSEAKKKIKALDPEVGKRLHFVSGNYKEIVYDMPTDFDAVMFMGNTLSYILRSEKRVLEEIIKVTNPQKAIMIFQISNFHSILGKQGGGPRDFSMIDIGGKKGLQRVFFSFYTRASRETVRIGRAVFDLQFGEWALKGINSTSVSYITEQEVKKMLRNIGFLDIKLYGASQYGGLFEAPFHLDQDFWMNVVAKRQKKK